MQPSLSLSLHASLGPAQAIPAAFAILPFSHLLVAVRPVRESLRESHNPETRAAHKSSFVRSEPDDPLASCKSHSAVGKPPDIYVLEKRMIV